MEKIAADLLLKGLAPEGFADTWPAPAAGLLPFSASPAAPSADWFPPPDLYHPEDFDHV